MDKHSLLYLKKLLGKKRSLNGTSKEDDPLKNLYGKVKEYVGGSIERKNTEGGGGFQEYVGGEIVPRDDKHPDLKEYVGGERVLKDKTEDFKEYVGGKIEYKDSDTERLYQEWLKTGRVRQDDSDGLNNRTNGLIQDFVKRRKREQSRQ